MKPILFFPALILIFSCSDAQRSAQENKKISEEQKRIVIVNGNDTITIPLSQPYIHVNDIPPRYQWNHNSGYCGEVSLVSAGLYFGQYLSQYDVREITCGKDKQNSCQMLLGVNDASAAKSLRLKYETKSSDDSPAFLNWVKQHVLQGHPVIIGVMNNEYQLYGDTSRHAGQPDYDHIVPVMGMGSDKPFSTEYDSSDVILFSDNGLITLNGDNPAVPLKGNALYYYDYQFKDFTGSRETANLPKGHPYTLIGLPQYNQGDSIYDYAIAILGVEGEEETLPVRMSTDLNYEAPFILSDANKRPEAMPLNLTVRVSQLLVGTKYYLYQYDNEHDVPYTDFNKNSIKYTKRTEIKLDSGSEFSLSMKILSDEKVFFRCVKAD